MILCLYLYQKQTNKAIMTTVTRDNEIMKVEDNKVELYKSCGWVAISDLFTFKNKTEENEAWLERFGD